LKKHKSSVILQEEEEEEEERKARNIAFIQLSVRKKLMLERETEKKSCDMVQD